MAVSLDVTALEAKVQIHDSENVMAYPEGTPFGSGSIELAGYRTVMAVPSLTDDGSPVGAIVIFRQEPLFGRSPTSKSSC